MPEAAEDVERRGSSVTKGELAASMASRISDSSAGASGASAIPLEPGDSMYEEMVLVSILLIQRLWRDKMRVRKRDAKKRRNSMLHKRLTSTSRSSISNSASAVDLTEPDEARAARSVTLIQANLRGKAQRAKIKETEAQILLEAQALSRVPPPVSMEAAAPAKGSRRGSVEAKQQPASSNLLGRDEQTEYIRELNARQDKLRKDIEKLEVDTLYTSIGDQRKRAVQLKSMRRQLNDLSREVGLVKKIDVSVELNMDGPASADENGQRPREANSRTDLWKASTAMVTEANGISVGMGLMTQVPVTGVTGVSGV